MSMLTAQLVRGLTAAVLIAWALAFQDTQPAVAVAAAIAAVIAMRGCPMCWMLGLVDAIGQTFNVRR